MNGLIQYKFFSYSSFVKAPLCALFLCFYFLFFLTIFSSSYISDVGPPKHHSANLSPDFFRVKFVKENGATSRFPLVRVQSKILANEKHNYNPTQIDSTLYQPTTFDN